MDRRGFLRGLAAGAIVVGEELWVPGAKLISIPKPTGHDYATLLAKSLYETKVQVMGRVLDSAAFRALLESQLNAIFEDIYANAPDPAFGESGTDLSGRAL